MTHVDSHLPHLFSSYNARQLDPEEVASTFVPSKKFWTLLEPNNSLLIGPRGSGKTTLLKMLQPSALAKWRHEQSDKARKLAQFHGVFIPTDLNWREQITVAVGALKPDERDTLTEALFVANTQLAVTTTLVQLAELPENEFAQRIEEHAEAKIVATLEKTWQFDADDVPILTFRALRSALRGRIRQLSSFRPNMPDRAVAVERIQKTLSRAQFDFETTLLEAFGLIEDLTRSKRKWALCFDEVELAPEFIQASLFKRLRSPTAAIYYKLAVAPYVPAAHLLNKPEMPGVSNDWKPIPLWYRDQSEAQRQEAQRFCYDLWQQIASKELDISYEPTLVFGQSEIGDQATSKPLPGFKANSRYGKNGVWQVAFEDLNKKDPSFREFLRRKDIDPARLEAAPAKTRDSVIRKIAPLVYYRARFIRSIDPSSGRVALNTTQVHSDIYSGWEAICAVCEGNPRWFKGIVDVLIKEWLANGRTLSRAFQARELQRAATRFRALVAACPVGDMPTAQTHLGPAQLVEHIAAFQRDQLLHRPFSSDPPLSVELGAAESSELVQLVSVCLNIGALISMDEEDSAISLSQLGGRRFRLSHLLAPSFVLPLRSGVARSLSSIMASQKTGHALAPVPASSGHQPSLWEAKS